MNISETKFNTIDNIQLTLDGRQLDRIDKYKYLGSNHKFPIALS